MFLGAINKPFHKAECQCLRCFQWYANEVVRLQAIVDQYPKSADGVPIVPGMTLWEHLSRPPLHVAQLLVRSNDTCRSEWMCDDGEIDEAQCYSTREAMEAATAEEPSPAKQRVSEDKLDKVVQIVRET